MILFVTREALILTFGKPSPEFDVSSASKRERKFRATIHGRCSR